MAPAALLGEPRGNGDVRTGLPPSPPPAPLRYRHRSGRARGSPVHTAPPLTTPSPGETGPPSLSPWGKGPAQQTPHSRLGPGRTKLPVLTRRPGLAHAQRRPRCGTVPGPLQPPRRCPWRKGRGSGGPGGGWRRPGVSRSPSRGASGALRHQEPARHPGSPRGRPPGPPRPAAHAPRDPPRPRPSHARTGDAAAPPRPGRRHLRPRLAP